jgi:hypothetical protein
MAIGYLDWLISNGAAPPALHDEFFLMLLTGLLSEEKEAAQQGRLVRCAGRHERAATPLCSLVCLVIGPNLMCCPYSQVGPPVQTD